MIRTHFTHSQFIVVSLKNGMFNNANVVFRTKFIDGVSTVTRYYDYDIYHLNHFLFVGRYNNIIANKENETDHGAHKNDSRQAVAVRSSIET